MKGYIDQLGGLTTEALAVFGINEKCIGYIKWEDWKHEENHMMIFYERDNWKKQIGKAYLGKQLEDYFFECEYELF